MPARSAESSNRQARRLWEHRAVGSQRAAAPKASREYFEQIRAYRYGYETPFVPRVFGFSDLAGKSVLEIGVGNGIDAVEMARHGAVYSGLDITENHLDLTRRNFHLHGCRFKRLYHEDLLESGITEQFDVVYSFGVLHHIEHEGQYLTRIKDLIKKGGTLRIAVYSRYSFFNFYMLATWMFRNRFRSPLKSWQSHVAELSELDEPVVIKIRSRRQVARLLEDNGYEVLSYCKRGFVGGYLPVVGRWLQPDGWTLNKLGALLGWYHIFICRPLR